MRGGSKRERETMIGQAPQKMEGILPAVLSLTRGAENLSGHDTKYESMLRERVQKARSATERQDVTATEQEERGGSRSLKASRVLVRREL